VLAQTCADLEVIAVDDGSTDATLSILERYAAADGRVRVMSQLNAGPSAARNRALAVAQGDVIACVDSDDLLPCDALERMLDVMRREDADIVEGGMVEFDEGKEVNLHPVRPAGMGCRRLTGEEAAAASLYQRGVTSSMSAKLYRRHIWDDIAFEPGILYEDLDLFCRLALRARRYVVCDATVYYYRQRPGSIIHTFNERRLVVLDVTRRLHQFMQTSYPQIASAAADRRLSANFNMLGLLLNDTTLDPSARERHIAECMHTIKSLRRGSLFDSRVRPVNRVAALLSAILPASALKLLLRHRYRNA
jgi:glycosyltransferase involved in cell wall biosynthesis